MKIKAHLGYPPSDSAQQTLLAHLDAEVQLTFGPDLPAPADFDVLVDGRPERAQVCASPRLTCVIIPWAGVPESTRELLGNFPNISVHNLHYNADTTAETALALLLSAAKSLLPIDHVFRHHDWTPRYQASPSILLAGKTILILGFGQIGQRVGRVCHALGMRVLGIRRHPARPLGLDYRAEIYGLENLAELLPQIQALMITLPDTPDTTELIGAGELAAMPTGGLLVNVGRAAVVEQSALFAALKNGHLAAAGLDVWYHYPESTEARVHTPPADFPFHELENVVLSPHRAGSARESEALRMQHLARLLNAAARGEPMPNRVDLQQGY